MKRKANPKTIKDLFSKNGISSCVINMITIYRIVTAPVLLVLLFTGHIILFRWLLLLSFTTDAIDGILARKYKTATIIGARLDSIGDDLTLLAAIAGVFYLKFDFIKSELVIVITLLTLYLVQTLAALLRYHRISSFHTYGAKIAAILQGSFLLSLFFFRQAFYPLFYFASVVTTIELVEEIILVALLPKWMTNVKGLYWILKKKKQSS